MCTRLTLAHPPKNPEQNVVAHVELPVASGMLDIQAMYSRLALNCTYQRKMFPGLILRPEASPVVLLCFYSGKIVITGGKTMSDIYVGWARLWAQVKNFITTEAPPNKRPRIEGQDTPHRAESEAA